MSAADPEVARLVRSWIEKADKDLHLAEFALEQAEPCPFDLVCYHAQQCAEKYLKAYHSAHQVEFPYTHNLRLLSRMVEEVAAITSFCARAGDLTVYESRMRYPYEGPEPDRGEAENAVALAREAKESVLQLLHREGFALS